MNEYQQGGELEFGLQRYLRALARYKYYVIIAVLVSFTGAYLYLRYTPKQYTSATELKISSASESQVIQLGDSKEGGLSTPSSSIDTEYRVELLRSRKVLKKVVDKLNLQEKVYTIGRVMDSPMYSGSPFHFEYGDQFQAYDNQYVIEPVNNDKFYIYPKDKEKLKSLNHFGKPVRINGDSLGRLAIYNKSDKMVQSQSYWFSILSMNSAIQQVRSSLSVDLIRKDGFVRMSYLDEVPEKTSDILNVIIEYYKKEELEMLKQSNQQSLSFIDSLVSSLSKDLDAAELALNKFEKNRDIPIAEIENQYGTSNYMSHYKELAEIKANLMKLSKIRVYLRSFNINQLKSSADVPDMLPTGSFEFSSTLTQKLTEFNEMLLSYKSKMDVFKPGSKPVESLESDITNSKIVLLQFVQSIDDELRRKQDNLYEELNSLRSSLYKHPELMRDFKSVEREYEINQEMINFLKRQRAQMSIRMAGIVSPTRVVNEAIQPTEPVKPKPMMIIGGSVGFSLLLSLGLIFLLDYYRGIIYNRTELSNVANLPIIGEIPMLAFKSHVARPYLFRNLHGSLAEAFRNLRVNISFLLRNRKNNIVTVTSTISKEGKSLISVNLASALSLLEGSTVLVDLDLRKPRLHTSFGIENNHGVTSRLTNMDSLDDIIIDSGYSGLDVIPSGPVLPNPAELLSSQDFETFVQELIERYDHIVFDTSPIGYVSDIIPALKYSDITLYVVRTGYSRSSFIEYLRQTVDSETLKSFYMVVNFSQEKKNVAYGAEGYNYGYKYGYYSYNGSDNGQYLQRSSKELSDNPIDMRSSSLKGFFERALQKVWP